MLEDAWVGLETLPMICVEVGYDDRFYPVGITTHDLVQLQCGRNCVTARSFTTVCDHHRFFSGVDRARPISNIDNLRFHSDLSFRSRIRQRPISGTNCPPEPNATLTRIVQGTAPGFVDSDLHYPLTGNETSLSSIGSGGGRFARRWISSC